jgi:signal peptidase II
VGCDQTAKSVAQSSLSQTEVWSLLGDTVRLQLAHNHGAFLSLGASFPEVWRQALFNVGVGVGALLLGVFIYALFAKIRPIWAI